MTTVNIKQIDGPVPVSGSLSVGITGDSFGIATSALQASIDGKLPPKGQAAMAASVPVIEASNSPLLTANSPVAAPIFPAQVTVGGAEGVVATQFSAQACVQGVWIQALSTNTVSVWIGGSDLTTAKGWELVPGADVFVSTTNINALYHISTTTGQKVNLRAA